jgi:hypothetical protein
MVNDKCLTVGIKADEGFGGPLGMRTQELLEGAPLSIVVGSIIAIPVVK